jgi:1,4-dihydroxy-2-naphthoate octaprenyltransferase
VTGDAAASAAGLSGAELRGWRRWFDFFYRRLRLQNPWNYKAPLLVAGPYFIIAAGQVPWGRALFSMLASLCTIAGIAGVAYFLNDLTDARKDVLAGKDNVVAGMSRSQRLLVLCLCLVAALGPWLYLPLTRISTLLLVLEFALFLVYCVPPLRLKERGVLGLLTDATYAHALPAVLAALTFSYLGLEPYARLREFLVALGVWQGTLGIRNIVLHQLQDHDADVRSGNRTLAVVLGATRLATLLTFGLVPVEVVAAGAFALVLSERMPWLVPAYGAFILLTMARLKLFGLPLPATARERLYAYADDFYTDWLPLLILGHLIALNPRCWPLAILHVLLFRNGLRQSWHDLKGRFDWLAYARVK